LISNHSDVSRGANREIELADDFPTLTPTPSKNTVDVEISPTFPDLPAGKDPSTLSLLAVDAFFQGIISQV
jgi:hypothetical protein